EKKLKALGSPAAPEPPRPEPTPSGELRARIASCEAAEESLTKEIKQLEDDLGRPEPGSAEAEAIRQEIAVRDELSKEIATALEKARLELAAPARAAWLEEATVSAGGDGRRVQLAGLTGAGFFLLALVGVGWLELRRRRLHTVGDVAQGLGLPVVGTQPLLP